MITNTMQGTNKCIHIIVHYRFLPVRQNDCMIRGECSHVNFIIPSCWQLDKTSKKKRLIDFRQLITSN